MGGVDEGLKISCVCANCVTGRLRGFGPFGRALVQSDLVSVTSSAWMGVHRAVKFLLYGFGWHFAV